MYAPARKPVAAAALPAPTGQSRIVFTTISEVLKRPVLLNGQVVRLKGKVARVQPPPNRKLFLRFLTLSRAQIRQ